MCECMYERGGLEETERHATIGTHVTRETEGRPGHLHGRPLTSRSPLTPGLQVRRPKEDH